MVKKKKAVTRKPTKWVGPSVLSPFLVPVDSIKLDPDNARVHDARNMQTIIDSLEKNGQVQTLVVYKGMVMAGNARLSASKEMGWTHVAVLDVSKYFTSKSQATAFGMMDNKSSELGTWDFEAASKLLKGLDSEWLSLTGFADFEIAPLMQGTFNPKSEGEMPEGHDDQKGISFWATNEQAEVIRRAINKLKSDGDDISDGRALELISGDFLS